MKILQINVTNESGSTGSIVKNINNSIFERYPQIQCYTAFVLGTPDDNSFKFVNCFDFFIIRTFRKLFGKSLFGTYFPTKRLIKYIKRLSPDIIHLHTIHHQTLNYKMLFKFLKDFKGKVFYTLHDCWSFTGGCYYYSEAGCDDFLNGCNKCFQNNADIDCKNSEVKREYSVKNQLLNDIPDITFITVSNWLACEAKKSFLRSKEIVTVQNGIDSNVFRPVSKKKNERFTVISVATAWTARKHLDILLELSKKLKDIDFIVVGNVKDNIEKSIYPNVKFVGKTKSVDELCELYNSADVFANFSTEETFGLVTAEAMACGLPVVVFNRTACGEIVDSDCGYVVGSVDEYAQALRQLKETDLKKYRDICRTKVVSLYTKEVMCQKYIDLYLNYIYYNTKVKLDD